MAYPLFARRTVWCPTLLGWVVIIMLVGGPLLLWWFQGESFLSVTNRQPADVLVVEGWIGIEGVRAAKVEFEQGGYRCIVTAGMFTNNRWERQHTNNATDSRDLLIRDGVSPDKVIEARVQENGTHRTFETAREVRRVLQQHDLHPAAVNVLTLGVHARRSRLTFAKVLQPEIRVGVISWIPSNLQSGPWWGSSERAEDFLKETIGYLFEALLNSGRTTNSGKDDAPK